MPSVLCFFTYNCFCNVILCDLLHSFLVSVLNIYKVRIHYKQQTTKQKRIPKPYNMEFSPEQRKMEKQEPNSLNLI